MKFGIAKPLRRITVAAFLSLGATTAWAAPKGDLVVILPTLGAENWLQPFSGLSEMYATFPMYETLLISDPATGLAIPGEGRLAENWEVAPDYKTYTFHIRKGVPFHGNNGEVTAHDVAYAFDLATRPGTKNSYESQLKANIDRVEVVDDHTIVFHMKRPWRDFSGLVTEKAGALLVPSKAYIERVGLDVAAREPVGTGPFRFKSAQLGDSISFEAVENHWRKEPRVQSVTIKAVPEPSTALALLKTGAAHLMTISFDQLSEAEAAGLKIHALERQNQTNIHLLGQYLKPAYDKSETPPWAQEDKDKAMKVRRALSLAIDRKEIAEFVLRGRGSAEGLCVAGFFPNNPGVDPTCETDPYDPDQAIALLKEAGYDGPEELKFTVSLAPHPNRPFNATILEAVAQQWANLGMDITIEKTTWANHSDLSGARKATFAASYAAPYFVDPAALLNIYTSSTGRVSFTGESEEADKLLPAAIGALNDVEYLETRKALFEQQRAGLYSIPVVYGDLLFALNPKLEIKLHAASVGFHNYELMGFTD